jgi:hypothetical protein
MIGKLEYPYWFWVCAFHVFAAIGWAYWELVLYINDHVGLVIK